MSLSEVRNAGLDLTRYRERYEHLNRSADIILGTLREAILDGQLPPGTRLREEELAREFGVSRTPIREALQILRTEGIIEFIPNQGARVTKLSLDDVLAIYAVREVLEGLAARLATTRMSADHKHALVAIVDEMEDPANSDDPVKMAEINLRFHAQMRDATDNPYLRRFLEQVEHAVRRFSQTTFSYPGRIATAIQEHRAICDAIVAGDADRAEALAVEHMRIARSLRIQMMLEGY